MVSSCFNPNIRKRPPILYPYSIGLYKSKEKDWFFARKKVL